MGNNLHIALLQMLALSSVPENMAKGMEYCRRAKIQGADIALFPEMWSIGYEISWNREENLAKAISLDSKYIEEYRGLAKELDMAIALTFLEAYEGQARNSMILIDRLGEIVLHYAKVHTCDFDVESMLCPGDHFPVCTLDTRLGPVKVGAMICYDREFPESGRLLMLQGAEVVLVPNACPMEINRISQLRTRAFENMFAIATCNYAYGKPDCNGHSTAFDGIAYREEENGSRDTLRIEAGEAEGIYLASIPLEELRDYREREVHGNAFRRPECYKALVEERVKYPFVREKKRRKKGHIC